MAQRLATAAVLLVTGLVGAAAVVTGLSRLAGAALFGVCAVAIAMLGWRREVALKAELAELRRQVGVEKVTALGDQQAFKDDLDREILRADRSTQPLCLIILSLDAEPWLERIDDLVRAAVARAMVAAVRRVDRGYRIGATEFALILPDTRARGGAVAARRVVDALLATDSLAGRVSAGVAEAGPGIDRRRLFRNAYVALLAAAGDVCEDVFVYAPELERPGRDLRLERLIQPGGAD